MVLGGMPFPPMRLRQPRIHPHPFIDIRLHGVSIELHRLRIVLHTDNIRLHVISIAYYQTDIRLHLINIIYYCYQYSIASYQYRITTRQY
jgi:hypothetical protein